MRYREIHEILTHLDHADYHWDLVVSLWRIADLTEGDGVGELRRALDILRCLDAAGRLYPQQKERLVVL